MDGIEVKGAKTLFQFGPVAITETIISLLVVTTVMLVAGILLGRKLQKRPGKLQVLTEMGVGMLMDLVSDTMGAHNIGWVPYIGTIFLSSLFGSLIGMTGIFRSTTADLAVVLTWSVMTSVIIWYQSIKRNGIWGWLKGFAEPIIVMTPMNIVSEIAQPLAMAFRHFGNVAGGSIITMIIYTALALASTALMKLLAGSVVMPILLLVLAMVLVIVGLKVKRDLVIMGKQITMRLMAWVAIIPGVLGVLGLLAYLGLLNGVEIPILQLGIPAVLSIYFDLFSGFVQAFVFCLLSMVYIAGACPPPEPKETDK